MASGVEVTEQVKQAINSIKIRHTHRYIIFKIDSGKIIPEECGDLSKNFDDLVDFLKNSEQTTRQGRYALFDMPETNKLVCMMWNPDTLPVKAKMLYSSSYDYLKKACPGMVYLELHDDDDLNYEEVKKKSNPKHLV